MGRRIVYKTKAGVRKRTYFETVSPLLIEGTIVWNKEEMRCRGSSQIAYCDARFNYFEDDCIEYVYDWPTPSYSIGVSFETLHSCLSAVSPNDTVTFVITEENQSDARPHVTIVIENEEIGYRYSHDIYLLLLETQELDDSEKLRQFDSLVSMSSSLLLRVLRNSAKRSDDVQIYTRNVNGKSKIFFRSSGDDASLLFSLDYETDGGDIVECLKLDVFSLKFLLLILKGTNLSNIARLYLKDEQYLAILYRLGVKSSVLFCLAPQIERATECPIGKLDEMNCKKVGEKRSAPTFKRPVKRRKKRVETKRVTEEEIKESMQKRKRAEDSPSSSSKKQRTETTPEQKAPVAPVQSVEPSSAAKKRKKAAEIFEASKKRKVQESKKRKRPVTSVKTLLTKKQKKKQDVGE